MKLYRPVKHLETIDYPTLDQVKAFTETYRIDYMPRPDPDKAYHKFNHSREVEVLTIGGINAYFLIYAYPPAGVTTAKPEDVLTYELWRGWILRYLWQPGYYYLDTATYREGYAAFKARKTELGY
ncbi:hypothetical protein ES708_23598 [subsurface metagenome]